MVQLVCLRKAALVMLFLITATIFSQPNETMPASIPDEIVADWKITQQLLKKLKLRFLKSTLQKLPAHHLRLII
jgi:hypothetical protein